MPSLTHTSAEAARPAETGADALRSGKGARDENFPVASRLVAAPFRAPILAFYDFVRVADDVADHPSLSANEKIAHLDRLEANLLGHGDENVQAVALRRELEARALSPEHAQDLLKAFRLDALKNRTANWDELIAYCAWSAMPVGRFMLDVHGESRATWASSDAICAALQIVNHLQDCGKDYRDLDRVYLPLDALAAAGAGVEDLAAPKASPALRRCLCGLAERAEALLLEGAPLVGAVADWRLGLEISVIQTLALKLARGLRTRDPLSERVHLGKPAAAGLALLALLKGQALRLGARTGRPTRAAGR